jgi:hypothetical protein
MIKPIPLSKHWATCLSSLPETGMGYQVVSVFLTTGRKIEQVVIDSGHITRARGYKEVPFGESEITAIQVTHDKWNREEEGGGAVGTN